MSDPKPPLVLLPYHETPHPFSAGDAGVMLDVRITKMTTLQYVAWRQQYDIHRQRPSQRVLAVRLPDEMETKPLSDDADPDATPEFVIPDSEIRRRRLDAMSPEDRAAFDKQQQAEDTAEAQFIETTVRELVTLAPGQVQMGGQDLTSGDDILRVFGGHLLDMRALVENVRIQHEAPASLKKVWRSLFASGGSSTAPASSTQAAAGPSPETLATTAKPEASASPAAVTASSATSTAGPLTPATPMPASSGATGEETPNLS